MMGRGRARRSLSTRHAARPDRQKHNRKFGSDMKTAADRGHGWKGSHWVTRFYIFQVVLPGAGLRRAARSIER
jgi:hypothetical protein